MSYLIRYSNGVNETTEEVATLENVVTLIKVLADKKISTDIDIAVTKGVIKDVKRFNIENFDTYEEREQLIFKEIARELE